MLNSSKSTGSIHSIVSGNPSIFDIQTFEGFWNEEIIPFRTKLTFRFIYATKGNLNYSVERKNVVLREHSIGIIRPGKNLVRLTNIDGEGFVISVSQEFIQSGIAFCDLMEALHLNLADSDQVNLSTDESLFLVDLAAQLRFEYLNTGRHSIIVESLFQVFSQYLSRSITSQHPDLTKRCQYHTKVFLRLLDQHFMTLKMPAEYAKLMAVTTGYLNDIIRETLGNTTSHFIQLRILKEAKKLLAYEELSMKEIAYKLGFLNGSHFSKFFKKISGERFSDFKRNLAA